MGDGQCAQESHGTAAREARPQIERLGKRAEPVAKWQYYILLSRAIPGASPHDLKWNLSRVEGWCAIHAAGILNGEVWIWPDLELSTVGRTFLRVRQLREAGPRDWAEDVDL